MVLVINAAVGGPQAQQQVERVGPTAWPASRVWPGRARFGRRACASSRASFSSPWLSLGRYLLVDITLKKGTRECPEGRRAAGGSCRCAHPGSDRNRGDRSWLLATIPHRPSAGYGTTRTTAAPDFARGTARGRKFLSVH